jgi:hypothetical protein
MWAWTGAAAATMLATAIFFASWHRGVEEQEDGAYVGAKGAPSVQVLVRSQESHAVVWNGQEPIRPGDSLAFRVACEGFRQVAIAAPSKDGRSWVRLSAAACPTDASPLPFTLVADEQPGDERLAVVLSRRPLNDETLAEVVQRQVRAADVFAILITLPKSPVSP